PAVAGVEQELHVGLPRQQQPHVDAARGGAREQRHRRVAGGEVGVGEPQRLLGGGGDGGEGGGGLDVAAPRPRVEHQRGRGGLGGGGRGGRRPPLSRGPGPTRV